MRELRARVRVRGIRLRIERREFASAEKFHLREINDALLASGDRERSLRPLRYLARPKEGIYAKIAKSSTTRSL